MVSLVAIVCLNRTITGFVRTMINTHESTTAKKLLYPRATGCEYTTLAEPSPTSRWGVEGRKCGLLTGFLGLGKARSPKLGLLPVGRIS